MAGVVSVAGFTPMRLNTLDRGTEGVKAYSHLHGLLPRLGFFTDNEKRIPIDFHEMLALVAPRPLLIIAPLYDKDAHISDIKLAVMQVNKIYEWYGEKNNIDFFIPEDYNRFTMNLRNEVFSWFRNEKNCKKNYK